MSKSRADWAQAGVPAEKRQATAAAPDRRLGRLIDRFPPTPPLASKKETNETPAYPGAETN